MSKVKRVVSYLSKQFNRTGDRSYSDAVSIVSKANSAVNRTRELHSGRKHYGTWDRWANGNQFGSYNSDDD